MPVDMAGITTFEELERWQRARELTRLIYRVSGDGDFGRDFALRDQIRRAAISVLSNIAEGFERGGNRELIQFLSLAKGSIGEVRAQLYVALDAGYISKQTFNELHESATRTSQLLGGLMRYLNRSELKGTKFHHSVERGTLNVER